MKRNVVITLSTAGVLFLITALALHLHTQSKRVVLSQFGEGQLDVARQVAREVQSHLRAYSVFLLMLASHPSLQSRDRKRLAADIERSFEQVKRMHALGISIFDEKGTPLYSTSPKAVALNHGKFLPFDELRQTKNEGKVFVSSLFRGDEEPQESPGSKPPRVQVVLATPLYRTRTGAGPPRPSGQFAGTLALVVNLEKLLAEHIVFTYPKMKLQQVWLMDRNGTLFFQSEHPEMGLLNIHQREARCYECHTSFDYAEKILSTKQGAAEYQIQGYPKRLAAYASVDFENASWVVVISAPYKQVLSFATKSLRDTAWLVGIVLLSLVAGVILVFRDYRLKVRAEEEARQLREKRALEDRVRESEERYRHLVELSPDTVAVTCEESIVFINTAGARLLGSSDPSEFVGREFLNFIHPEDREITKRRIREMREHPEVCTIEEKLVRLDGTEIDGEVMASPFLYQGKPSVQVIIRDITERKRAEREIKKLNEDLLQRAAELEEANKELEAFSYSVSHDLRNPLTVIGGFASLLKERHSAGLGPEGQRYLEIVRNNTRAMEKLIEDLLTFSRLGRQGLHPEPLDIKELAEEVFAELRTVLPDRKVVLKLDDPPHAFGDRAMVRQVLVNLFSNAIKYSQPRDTAAVEMGGHVADGETVYYVRDHGIGFDMAHYDKLFAPFQRLHAPGECGGSGVGLATVHRIVSRHGGRVWAEGKVDQGATFYFSLPSQDR